MVIFELHSCSDIVKGDHLPSPPREGLLPPLAPSQHCQKFQRTMKYSVTYKKSFKWLLLVPLFTRKFIAEKYKKKCVSTFG